MPYPKPTWVAPLWWVPRNGASPTSRHELVVAWVARAEPPKPRKKEFVDEIKGWSGILGRSKRWVERKYGATTAKLACSDLAVDSPPTWLTLSQLYAEYVDTLARFTAQFAMAAHDQRPRGVPHVLTQSVKSYELAVPRAVRAVMAGPRIPPGLGEVVDTERAAADFVADPDAHHRPYHAVAMRHYASILRDKLSLVRDRPDVYAAFAERIAVLAEYGEPEPPRRAVTPAEESRVDELLSAVVSADPTLRTDPDLSVAYLRARKIMLRWIGEGREVTDAMIVYTKLRSARLDAGRARRIVDRHEISFDATALPPDPVASDPEPMAIRRVADADIVSRAEQLLIDYPAHVPGTADDCWEKTIALRVLTDPSAPNSYARLRATVAEAWNASRKSGKDRPERAVSATAAAAADLADALLFLVISSSAHVGDLPPENAAAQRRMAARQAGYDDVLHARGYAVDDIGAGE
ncbi:hypothetical protein [Nocardia sp. BMG111209]|uniref:hypothetical protein n=1 Tax=Nocardia sp. BMG111209 TaxID=1160137 RepID=UPI0003772726|nr:hypothetical protein [Nocardia sp. BMG111209]